LDRSASGNGTRRCAIRGEPLAPIRTGLMSSVRSSSSSLKTGRRAHSAGLKRMR
jgi:hypothetical protein